MKTMEREAGKNMNIIEMLSNEIGDVEGITSKQAGDILLKLAYILENNSVYFYGKGE